MLTKEEMQIALENIDSINEAKHDFYRAIPISKIKQMEDIYNAHGERMISRSCSRCVLTMLKWFGEQVDETIKNEEEEIKPIVEEEPQAKPKKTKRTTKKNGN